jgi:hypothetical protein
MPPNRRHVSTGLALTTALALLGCAARSDLMRPTPRPQAWSAPTDAAVVVFIRPTSFSAAIKTTLLDEQGNFVGDSLPTSYFAVNVTPGEHVFIAWAQNTAVLQANLAAGRTYFVEVALTTGLWAPRVDLLPLTPRSEGWSRRGEWLRESSSFAADPQRGRAALAGRKGDVEGQLRRARSVLNDYSAAELARVSLRPDDGI